MQTKAWDFTPLSSGFAAMAAASQRNVIFEVFVNWNRTAGWVPNPESGAGTNVASGDRITQYVKSIQEERDLTGDTPAGSRLVTGQGVASATIELVGASGGGGLTAAMLWSPFSSGSPYYTKKRIGSPMVVFVGFNTGTVASPNLEYVTKFTGYVRSIDLDTSGQTATLEALDPSDRLRTLIRYPLVLSGDSFGLFYDRWGLNSQWPIAYALEQNGYYCSPPPRATTVLRQTCHGSMWPEIGKGNYCFTNQQFSSTPTLLRPTFAQGLFGLQNMAARTFEHPNNEDIVGVGSAAYFNGTVNYGPTSSHKGIQFEMFFYLSTILGPGSGTLGQFNIYSASAFVQPGSNGDILVNMDVTGTITCTIYGSTNTTITSTTAKLTQAMQAAPVFVGVHFRINSATSITVTFNVNGTIETQTVTMASSYPNKGMRSFQIDNVAAGIENVMVSSDPTPVWDSQTWAAPNAVITPGLNELDVIVPPKQADKGLDAWATISDLANAEFGVTALDEHGHVYFVNRQELINPTFSGVLTGATNVKNVQTTEAVDQIVNHATANITPYVVQPYSWVWSSSTQHGLHSGATTSDWITLTDPVYGMPSELTVAPS